MKPGVVDSVLRTITKGSTDPLIVSIAAGITIASMESLLWANARVIRIMPNTPCLVGSAASAISAGTHATSSDIGRIQQLMSLVGAVIVVPESKLDAVTGLSGSGPAYVFTMIEALADGGVAVGLSREQAQLLAAQTVLGSAKMVLETGRHPAQLKDQVASPAGTTIAGLVALEKNSFRFALIQAVIAATERAHGLSEIRK